MFQNILKVIALIPSFVGAVEGFFGGKGQGASKKAAVKDIVDTMLAGLDATGHKFIRDQKLYDEGFSELNDAVVKILNASEWHK